MVTTKGSKLKHRSREITDGPERAPARSMLYAMGLTPEDLSKPFIGIANLASDVTPCNVHLDRLAQEVRVGVKAAEGTPFEFGTITVSDGISHGYRGHESLPCQPGGDSRFYRTGCLWPAVRRPGNAGRMRQKPARHSDGRYQAEHPHSLRLRRHDPARPF